MLEKCSVWLDCDPGHDDMMAIILAVFHPKSHLIGVSSVDGNSTLENTTQNVLNILHGIGCDHIPVVVGSPKPIARSNFNAPEVHGKNGLAGAQLVKAPREASKGQLVEEVTSLILKSKNKVKFVVTGPMTNLAILFNSGSKFYQNVQGFYAMGGAIGRGNVTPAAEFNILVDPEAARICIDKCSELGKPMHLVPLEVTHEARAFPHVMAAIKEMDFPFASKVYDLIDQFRKMYKDNQNFDDPPIHDPCAMLLALEPQHFEVVDCEVKVECESKFSDGRTNVTWLNLKEQRKNCRIALRVEVSKFWERMLTALRAARPKPE